MVHFFVPFFLSISCSSFSSTSWARRLRWRRTCWRRRGFRLLMLFQADEEEALLVLLLPCDLSMRIKKDITKAELVEDDWSFILIRFFFREFERKGGLGVCVCLTSLFSKSFQKKNVFFRSRGPPSSNSLRDSIFPSHEGDVRIKKIITNHIFNLFRADSTNKNKDLRSSKQQQKHTVLYCTPDFDQKAKIKDASSNSQV